MKVCMCVECNISVLENKPVLTHDLLTTNIAVKDKTSDWLVGGHDRFLSNSDWLVGAHDDFPFK